jgi:phospholipase/lecithinase/hemolysin
VWIGANDLLQAISNVATATTSASMAITQLTAAAQAEANAINMLAQAGGKNFLVPLVPDLGQTPRLNATALKGTASTLTADYNAALQSA